MVAMGVAYFLIPRHSTLSRRTLRFSLDVQNETNRTLRGETVEFLSPRERGNFSRLARFSASVPHRFTSDATGTRSAVLELGTLAPLSTRTVEVEAEVEGWSRAKGAETGPTDRYLRAERFIEIDAPEIRAAAAKIQGRSSKAVAKNAFDWITRDLESLSRENHDRGALYALKNKKGDCTELAYLYTAVLRAKNIPARPIAGIVTKESRLVSARDYHNWVEVLVDGEWRIVDPHKRLFMEREDEFIPLRIVAEDGVVLTRSRSFFAEPDGTKVTLR